MLKIFATAKLIVICLLYLNKNYLLNREGLSYFIKKELILNKGSKKKFKFNRLIKRIK